MNENGLHYYIETSSKNGDNVTNLFKIMTKHLHITNYFASSQTKPRLSFVDVNLSLILYQYFLNWDAVQAQFTHDTESLIILQFLGLIDLNFSDHTGESAP